MAPRLLDGLGELEQALGGVGAAIEQHVFDALAQLGGNLLVDGELAGVDDAHVHAGADGVVEERGVHGFADDVIAAEGKRDVADAAADLGAGQLGLDLARGFEESHRVVIVLLDAGGRR